MSIDQRTNNKNVVLKKIEYYSFVKKEIVNVAGRWAEPGENHP